MWGMIFVLALMIPLLAVVLDSQLGRALAARLERPVQAGSDGMEDRLAALEAEVERLQRLLESKPASGGTLPAGGSTD